MEKELSMASRAEVTNRFARAYAKASKKDKGRVLDQGTSAHAVGHRCRGDRNQMHPNRHRTNPDAYKHR